ncbi:MAG: hypothetical protein Q7S21_02250, partial [archaeon]|nr:hypothetical protein [archaeon]
QPGKKVSPFYDETILGIFSKSQYTKMCPASWFSKESASSNLVLRENDARFIRALSSIALWCYY